MSSKKTVPASQTKSKVRKKRKYTRVKKARPSRGFAYVRKTEGDDQKDPDEVPFTKKVQLRKEERFHKQVDDRIARKKALLERKKALLEQKKKNEELAEKERQRCLPHLYGFKWYRWAKEYFDSTAKENFLCAANQISKSSTNIRKCIDWATDQKKWPLLWRRRPLVFWYLYPSKEVATVEFEKKWVPEFLPKDSMKDDPVYGWKEKYRHGFIHSINFHSGVTIFFKTYATDVQNLQAGTVDAVFCDEELPEDLYDEINQRRRATDGYFHMVFTATLGQETWRLTIQPEKGEKEKYPEAAKWQISKYDCQYYLDGTPSFWTDEYIQKDKNLCSSATEILRRVYGKFVKESGRVFQGFTRARNVKPGHMLPKSWHVYEGVDIGAGGKKNHPSAIVFLAVSPDYTQGRVFRGWRGDDTETTAGDVFIKHVELKGKLQLSGQAYDFSSKEFGMVAQRNGEPFRPAEKAHEFGYKLMNVLFKNGMLEIYDYDELQPLVTELTSLLVSTPKTKAKDDFADALRYAVCLVPWDLSVITGAQDMEALQIDSQAKPKRVTKKDLCKMSVDELRALGPEDMVDDYDAETLEEIEEYNALL